MSSGAIAQGMKIWKLDSKPKSIDFLQALSAAGQIGLINSYQKELKRFDLITAQVLLSHSDFKVKKRSENAKKSISNLINLGIIFFVMWMIYFSLGAFASMTEDKLLMEGVNSARNDFKNFTLHLEFRLPYMPKARGQSRGNSGMYLLGTETQMLDSFGLSGEANECGGLYKWKRPDINMCYPPLRWQTYDVEFKASENGNPSVMTVKHNGVVIHDNVQLRKRNSQGNIHLQNHSNPVRYRNIWIAEKD